MGRQSRQRRDRRQARQTAPPGCRATFATPDDLGLIRRGIAAGVLSTIARPVPLADVPLMIRRFTSAPHGFLVGIAGVPRAGWGTFVVVTDRVKGPGPRELAERYGDGSERA